MRSIADRVMRSDVLPTFSPHGLANIVWAFASLQVVNEPLMSALAERIVHPEVIVLYNPQVVPSTLDA